MIAIFKKTSWWIIIPAIVILLLFFLGGFGDHDYSNKKFDTIMKNGMQMTCDQLDEYYSENGVFPTSLSTLKTEFPENQKYYLYAFYPAEKPNSYHIGITLRFKEEIDLNDDSDFDSKTAGYINGFNGKDPVYDLYITK